jgi:hypothetical protein
VAGEDLLRNNSLLIEVLKTRNGFSVYGPTPYEKYSNLL